MSDTPVPLVVIHYSPSANKTARLEIEMRRTAILEQGGVEIGNELVPAADPTALAAQLIASGATVQRIVFQTAEERDD